MIDVNNLTKYYGNNKVLDDISFHIEPGKTVGFLGNNGAGKSTTMNILTGYLAATSGSTKVCGYDVVQEPMEARKNIGYCPENPPLYNELTVYEYLCFASDVKNVRGKDKKREVEKILDILKIEHMRNRLISNLSRGYRQRVGLAQALCGDPKVLILDEPTVGLDPTQIIDIRNTIKELGGKHTIILSSHILHEVADICDHIMILHNGKIVANDSLRNMYSAVKGKNKLVVRMACDPSTGMSLLKKISGLKNIKSSYYSEGKFSEFIMTSDSESRHAQAIANIAVANGIGLMKLTDESVSLEDMFLSYTRES